MDLYATDKEYKERLDYFQKTMILTVSIGHFKNN